MLLIIELLIKVIIIVKTKLFPNFAKHIWPRSSMDRISDSDSDG